MANSVEDMLNGVINGDDNPTGEMAEVKVLPGVTVTGTRKKSWLDKAMDVVNAVTTKVKLPTVGTEVKDDTIIKVGIVLAIVALIFVSGRRK